MNTERGFPVNIPFICAFNVSNEEKNKISLGFGQS